MASYVIRGGEEGKARLSVLSAALAPSTASLLAAAGVGDGMRVLDPFSAELEAFCAEADTIVAFPRIFQVFGHRPR
jgi:hypothetical protein